MPHPRAVDVAQIAALIDRKRRDCSGPVVVGVSGFAGSGKSTLDLTVWVEVPLETARERGKLRDETLGRDFARLCDEVWVPNEIGFSPRDRSDDLDIG